MFTVAGVRSLRARLCFPVLGGIGAMQEGSYKGHYSAYIRVSSPSKGDFGLS